MANGLNVTGIVNESNNSVTFTSSPQTTVLGVVGVGLKGDTGDTGPQGEVGPEGPIPVVFSTTPPIDTDYLWVDTDDYTNLNLPDGGTTGQVLAKTSNTDYEADWTTISTGVTDHTLLTNIGTNTHAQIDTALAASASHIANTSNPHSVTKSQVGLSNVDDTSDANKPISTAAQTALNLKANLASPTFTGTPVVSGSSGNMKFNSSSDGGEFNISSNASGTLAIFGEGGNTLNVDLLDGTFKIGGVLVPTVSSGSTLTNKSIDGGSNTVTGLVATTALSATGTKDATTFLRGDNTWAVPAGGGGGGMLRSVNNVSSTTSAGATASTDYVYFTTGTFTLTLPNPSGNTNRYSVVNKDGGTVTVATAAGTILGSSTITMATQYQSRDFVSDGTNWYIL